MEARSAGTFLVRLVLYALGIGLAVVIARAEWGVLGLDSIVNAGGPVAERIARWQSRAPVGLALATVVLAAFGRVSRLVATLLLWALMAAIVTAPIAIAHATGG